MSCGTEIADSTLKLDRLDDARADAGWRWRWAAVRGCGDDARERV
jgi:hypothetical protein